MSKGDHQARLSWGGRGDARLGHRRSQSHWGPKTYQDVWPVGIGGIEELGSLCPDSGGKECLEQIDRKFCMMQRTVLDPTSLSLCWQKGASLMRALNAQTVRRFTDHHAFGSVGQLCLEAVFWDAVSERLVCMCSMRAVSTWWSCLISMSYQGQILSVRGHEYSLVVIWIDLPDLLWTVTMGRYGKIVLLPVQILKFGVDIEFKCWNSQSLRCKK